ncbi:thioredoxin-related transmembrane protein 1-like [Artemia franciscana]|uniref:thioredoxin-related transmembrane protein 1-like n=1 Tax=Artemia franciscana TaxID=6661 RepID=UPI0032DAC1FA
MISFKAILFLYLATFVCAKEDDVIVIGEDNWKDLLKGEWMIEFHARWCPACRTLQPVWEDLGSWSDDLGIKVARVDVTDAPALIGRFMTTALPTIFHAIDGEFRKYKGPRGKDDFITFIEEKKWKEIEPLSSWKAPDSVWMSTVAWFFKMSMFLRGAFIYLTEDVGVPYWAGYCIFAALSVTVGAIPSLIFLVFFTHLLCPPKSEPKKKAKSDDEKDNEHEDKDNVVAEDLIDQAVEKKNRGDCAARF